MQPPPLTRDLASRPYTPGQIALASFLGSPLAASWFFYRNYKIQAQAGKAVQSLVWGVVGTIVLFVVCWFLPENFPSMGIPVGYTIGLMQVAKGTHGAFVENHRTMGGRLGSWWVVVGVSLLVLALILAVLFGVVFFFVPEEVG